MNKIFEIEIGDKNEIRTIKEKTNPIVIQPSYALFTHQIEVLNKVNEILKSSIKRALLHMPTGAGKTRTTVNLLADYFKKNKRIRMGEWKNIC